MTNFAYIPCSTAIIFKTEYLGDSISSKFSLDFSSFSLGATESLGNGPMILAEMIPLLDVLERTY